MERFARIARYFRKPRTSKEDHGDDGGSAFVLEDDEEHFLHVIESILLWENSVNSISVVVVFNILFWGIVILEVRGFAAASSAALVVVLCYNTLEAPTPREKVDATTQAKTEQIKKFAKKARSTICCLKQMRKDQPGVFCSAVCSVSLGLWLLGRAINGVLLVYTICMSILIGPVLLLQFPSRTLSNKEWDSELEDFLPAVTEDNLQVLKRAGDSRQNSPTPPSVDSDSSRESINDDDLVGLRMPSHEGSVDGLELSELELSTGEIDIADGIKFQTSHFERGSSSEEEAELRPPESKKLSPHRSDDSDSEFEIIDSREVAGFKGA